MAMNPMQRKGRNSFLLGMFITLFIAGAIIIFLILQMNELKEEKKYGESATVYVLAQDVSSGQIITSDMLIPKKVNPKMVPNNSQGVMSLFDYEYLVDQNGNRIYGDSEFGLYYEVKDASGNTATVSIYNDNGKYYAKSGGKTSQVIISGIPVVARIAIAANTPLTTEMVKATDDIVANDVRLEEYNMVTLPSTLEIGEYIDIRLTLPGGQDYVVISKKEVKNCDLSTIWLEVSEDEIVTMNNAIIESYIMKGANLYAVRYVEPGMQTASIPTYPVSAAVSSAMTNNPNILKEALDAYYDKITQLQSDRKAVDSALSGYAGDKIDNVEDGVEEAKLKSYESRIDYIEGL